MLMVHIRGVSYLRPCTTRRLVCHIATAEWYTVSELGLCSSTWVDDPRGMLGALCTCPISWAVNTLDDIRWVSVGAGADGNVKCAADAASACTAAQRRPGRAGAAAQAGGLPPGQPGGALGRDAGRRDAGPHALHMRGLTWVRVEGLDPGMRSSQHSADGAVLRRRCCLGICSILGSASAAAQNVEHAMHSAKFCRRCMC